MSSARGADRLRVVLTSIGSRGDVQPMLAIAQALGDRGHRAVVAAPPDFGPWVRELGFEFAPLGDDVRAFLEQHRNALGANALKLFNATRRIFADEPPRQMQALLDLARGADAIVFAGGSVMAPSAGEKLGIPVLGVLFTSCLLPSREYAPVMVPWRTLPKWMNRLLWGPSAVLWNWLMREGMNRARKAHGLASISSVAKHLFEGTPFVLAADEQALRPDPIWSARVPPVGFLFLEPRGAALDAGLDAWLREGEPPVFAGFGSMKGRGPERMRRVLVDALESTGRRALLGAGWAGVGEGALPAGWRIVHEAPHALLFPRAACIVHHGGSGTTASALRAGVPQVLVPLILDQYHHAQRLFEAGLAPRPIPMERISSAQLASSIATAMDLSPRLRRDTADRLAHSDAASDIAARIERMSLSR